MVNKRHNIFESADFAQAITQAEARYCKMAVIVGPQGAGKTALLGSIAKQFQFPIINLGLELSRLLLPLTVSERKLKAADIIADLFDEKKDKRLGVDNTEIVFDEALMLNPAGLFQNISRTKLLVWTWNGAMEGDYITYATSGHPEYRRVQANDLTLITT